MGTGNNHVPIFYTVSISFDFVSTASSIFAINLSVNFCASSSRSLTSSSDMPSSFPAFFMLSIASRLILRVATFASSPFFLMSFASSLRRSSVSSGNTRRMSFPSFVGFIPRSEHIIAYSISFSIDASQGWI